MGVKTCDRKSCTHIMCDRLLRLVPSVYICPECYSELSSLAERWRQKANTLTKSEMLQRLREFMATPPGTYLVEDPEDVDSLFKSFIEE